MKSRDFSFLNLDSNSLFSDFKGIDLQELLNQLNLYYITLRDKLGFSDDITFGLEMESEMILNSKKLIKDLDSKINKNSFINQDWGIDSTERSLTFGVEVISPILVDSEQTWKSVEQVCKFIKKYGNIWRHSAGHIHIGTQTIGADIESWLNFLKIWGTYENIIYRFAYGEFLCKLPGISYCNIVGDRFLNDYKGYSELIEKGNYVGLLDIIHTVICRGRECSVNFENVMIDEVGLTDERRKWFAKQKEKNTIEFRCPNGTLNPVIWQNNVNLFVTLLLYSKNKSKYNHEIIDRRMNSIPKHSYNLYDEIYLEQAIELIDLIFEKNLDKINFLKQYLKSFEMFSGKPMKRVKSFTE